MEMKTPNDEEANSYVDLDYFQDFAESRGEDIPEDEDDQKQLLMKAMDYLQQFNWVGEPSNKDQSLDWPRDFEGKRKYLPEEIKKSQCMLAIYSQDTDLFPVYDPNSPGYRQATVGPISVTFNTDQVHEKGSKPTFPYVDNLIDEFKNPSGKTNGMGLNTFAVRS